MRLCRLLLAAVLTGLAVLVLAPAPAFACSCVGGDARQFVRWAEVVLLGTVQSREGPDQGSSTLEPATYTITVERVLTGTAAATTRVLSPESGASCGLEDVELGRRYVVFAAYRDIEGRASDELWASLCGGTAPASAAFVAEVESVTGPGRPGSGIEVVEPGVDEAGGAVLALTVGGTALWLLRRRRTT